MNNHNLALQSRVCAETRKWIGTPYQHQASFCHVGCDCLGLIRGVWRSLYGAEPYDVPAYSVHWAETGKAETLLEAAQLYLHEISPEAAVPGDVLLFRFSPRHIAKHCAILTGPSRMIHAYWGRSVTETSLTPWWQRRIAAAFQFPHING